MASHCYWRMSLILLSFVSFLIVCVFNALSSVGYSGLFNSTQANVSDKYDLEITPAGWTFSVWGLIYAWQAAFMIYALITLCIKTSDGYLYNSPAFISSPVYAMYTLNLASNVAWIFMFDTENLEAALGVLMFTTLSLYFCIGATMRGLSQHSYELIKQGKRLHVILQIVIVQNGLAIYAAWVSIATLLNLGMVLTYVVDVTNHVSCAICLGILALDVLVYALIDLVLFERHFRYVFTPFIPLVMGLIGSLDKNWDTTNANTIFTVTLLALGGVHLLVKIGRCVYKSCTDPLYVSNSTFSPTSGDDEKNYNSTSSSLRLT